MAARPSDVQDDTGKAHALAGNVQALTAPGGVPLWVSDVLPGSTTT
jgi:hypothetical protein